MTTPVRILVADDDRALAELLSDLLTREGYQVTIAHDGAEALKRVRELRPSVVVLDVMMPVMDGFRVCRALKEDPSLAPPPKILILTVRESDRDRAVGTFLADAFLTKPFHVQDLSAKVKELLHS
ncbi:MAG: response regulator [Elusimicrobia bacterium]|nr:response regulator [Elusimicrobiota bacterium]